MNYIYILNVLGRNGFMVHFCFITSAFVPYNLSYDTLHDLADNHHKMRHLMGIEKGFGYERVEFEYQNIYDNVTMLSDELVAEINKVILDFGQDRVLKKRKYSFALKVR